MYSLSNSPEVGQQVLWDSGDKLFGCIIQQVTLQHIQHSVERPHAAGEVCAPQRRLQQATHRLCDCFVLGNRHWNIYYRVETESGWVFRDKAQSPCPVQQQLCRWQGPGTDLGSHPPAGGVFAVPSVWRTSYQTGSSLWTGLTLPAAADKYGITIRLRRTGSMKMCTAHLPSERLHWWVWLGSFCCWGSLGSATDCRAPEETGNTNECPPLHGASWKIQHLDRLHLCLVTNGKDKGVSLSHLELMGDNGGEVAAGASASSSSSSPHSSSLSGFMLLPSHTEWIDTLKKRRQFRNSQGFQWKMMKNLNLIYTLVQISYLTQFVVHVAQLPLCVDLKQQLLVAYQRACCNHNKFHMNTKFRSATWSSRWILRYLVKRRTVRAQGPKHGIGGTSGRCPSLTQEPESPAPPLPWSLQVSFQTWAGMQRSKSSKCPPVPIMSTATEQTAS